MQSMAIDDGAAGHRISVNFPRSCTERRLEGAIICHALQGLILDLNYQRVVRLT